eukprot:355343-Chlamydomonas_euryale.AAC.5
MRSPQLNNVQLRPSGSPITATGGHGVPSSNASKADAEPDALLPTVPMQQQRVANGQAREADQDLTSEQSGVRASRAAALQALKARQQAPVTAADAPPVQSSGGDGIAHDSTTGSDGMSLLGGHNGGAVRRSTADAAGKAAGRPAARDTEGRRRRGGGDDRAPKAVLQPEAHPDHVAGSARAGGSGGVATGGSGARGADRELQNGQGAAPAASPPRLAPPSERLRGADALPVAQSAPGARSYAAAAATRAGASGAGAPSGAGQQAAASDAAAANAAEAMRAAVELREKLAAAEHAAAGHASLVSALRAEAAELRGHLVDAGLLPGPDGTWKVR